MVFGRQSIGAGVLAMALAGAGPVGGGQQASQQNTTQTAQQQNVPNAPTPSIPNAPTPQGLSNLNTITPPAPMAPEPPRTGAANPDAGDNGGTAPTSQLPSSTPGQQTGGQQTPPIIAAPGQGAQEAYTLSTHVDFVQIPFTVKDSKGHFVPDLTWRDVRIYENGVFQHMALWNGTDPYALSVAFVIDQSVTQDTMDKINTALGAVQGAFAPYDEVAVYTYNNGVTEQTTFTASQSPRLGVALERSKGEGREPLMGWGGPLAQTTIKNNQNVDPNTAPIRNQTSLNPTIPKEYHLLYDAMFTAAQALAKVGPRQRRVLYVISDGKEYGSKVKEKELIHYLQENKISVYATLVGNSAIPGMGFLDRVHLPLTMRDDALPRIAAATGGQCAPEWRPRGIEDSFAELTKTVRTLYTVGYYTHESPLDGRFRHVEIRVMRPNLTVIAPDGYYPTPRNVHPAMPVAGAAQTPHPDNQAVPPPENKP